MQQDPTVPRLPKLVMVVEDDHLVRDIISEALATEGFEVLSASDGVYALDQLTRFRRPSLALVDLWLPRMDGWNFIKALRADPLLTQIPIIAISGDATVDHVDGVVALVRKPVDLLDLVDKVRHHAL